MSATLYYEYYFWESYKKKLSSQLLQEISKGYTIKDITII